ncbi:MAG: GntR family transcriptional regulator [Pontimonas sp.]|nr:GntR family transcriptional regulator [Pontimonas sp.]
MLHAIKNSDVRLPLRQDSLTVQTQYVLRELILDHKLPPGSRLSVPEIAKLLGVSRTPAREAIAEIVSEGLAVKRANRGAVVVDLTGNDLVEIYLLREVLEGLAARLATLRRTPQQLTVLEEILTAHDRAVKDSNIQSHFDLDREFHTSILEIAGNERLTTNLGMLRSQIDIAMKTTHKGPGGIALALDEHRSIFHHISNRNPSEAEEAARRHIQRLRESLKIEFPAQP